MEPSHSRLPGSDEKSTLAHPSGGVWEPGLLGLNGNEDRLFVARTAEYPWWTALLPRMMRPPGDLAIIDVEQEAVLATAGRLTTFDM